MLTHLIRSVVGATILLTCGTLFSQQVTLPQVRNSRQLDGLYENHPQLIAIKGGSVTRFPGDDPSIETILIRDGHIESVGPDIAIPKGARVVDADGFHIYAGFIDLYHEIEIPFDHDRGTSYWNDQVRPQVEVASSLTVKDLGSESHRKSGVAVTLCAPKDGVIKGQSALLLMLDEETPAEEFILHRDVAQHFHLTVSRGRGSYPNSPMGAVALARQAMYDAQWYGRAASAEGALIESNSSLEALQSLNEEAVAADSKLNGRQQLAVFETSNELFSLRANRFAREFQLNRAVLLGNGHEYRRLESIAKTGLPIILPVNFPKPPEVGTPEQAANVSLETLMHWEHAPKNPAALSKASIPLCFTSHGLKDDDDFLDKVRHAIKHGLSSQDALKALTTAPAKLVDHDESLGKIEPKFIANLVVSDKPIFDDKSNVVQTWVAGKQFDVKDAKAEAVVWSVTSTDGNLNATSLQISDDSIELFKGADTSARLKHEKNSESVIAGAFAGKKFGFEGWVQLSVTLNSDEAGTGTAVLPDGASVAVSVVKTDREPFSKKPASDTEVASDKTNGDADSGDESDASKDIAAISKVNFPFGYAGVESIPESPGSVLFTNVTVWTCSEKGALENASVLISDGKIKAVIESGGALPTAEIVVDGEGAHLTPGIIDCHSHMASDSGINESGQAITAEVRIGDMIDCDDITIYRQLAGGVTTANILHGSANPIGGQNQVIKLRWGALDEDMKFKGAPAGIKFALGENVKQSNWENPTNRYPQTRMGVEQLFDNAFEEAKLYREKQRSYKGVGVPPRVNLELEAIAEIVERTRWIHCHSYRQDEILSLIRLLDRHKIQIGTFQHILEGYKVADELKKHGAMGSAFSDWWAYKYEVKDAIPQAGALMHQRGVVMSFNSDDAELARHLNREAAKAVRYGGLSFEEALNFVTINPAKQLRIEVRVGSIEVGKDADLVLWSGHPLSNLSIAKQTWIDGRKYYDRDEDTLRHAEFVSLKQQLVQKVLRSGEEMESGGKESTDPAKFWPRYDAFCGHSHHHGHDHDDDHDHQGHDHE
jgi:N-acetylglucosamine-6-phosphate deacetylase